MNEPSMNPVDALLDAAFHRALAEPSADLVATVMARIRRRQRLRLVVLGTVWTIAAAIFALSAMPLLASLGALFADVTAPPWHPSLPVLIGLAAACIFGGWLLLEEPA